MPLFSVIRCPSLSLVNHHHQLLRRHLRMRREHPASSSPYGARSYLQAIVHESGDGCLRATVTKIYRAHRAAPPTHNIARAVILECGVAISASQLSGVTDASIFNSSPVWLTSCGRNRHEPGRSPAARQLRSHLRPSADVLWATCFQHRR